MDRYTRRRFLERVGASALLGAVGLPAAHHLGLSLASAHADGEQRLEFGEIEPLVDLMQSTQADVLLPLLKLELEKGTSLQRLISAATLANVRTFAGQDYVGYHCFFALVPAIEMARRMPEATAALPVFKVLYRNATRIQEKGGRNDEALKPLAAMPPGAPRSASSPQLLLAESRRGDVRAAETVLSALASSDPQSAYGALQPVVQDNIDVHQVVLMFRSWDMLSLLGEEHAEVMLRQSLRQCIDRERDRERGKLSVPTIRSLLPKLVEAHGLAREVPPTRRLSNAELNDVAEFVFTQSRDASAEHIAVLLGEGVSKADVGEALSLASAWLLLHDPGVGGDAPGKPKGSVHGPSIGLHAADSANAWRGIAAATSAAAANASLVTGAWHTAGQSRGMDTTQPFHAAARAEATRVAPQDLLPALDEALRGRDQAVAAALVEQYGAGGGDPGALIDALIQPAIEHDGALHHEKYFLTATQEFARTRAALRFVHMVALARVMASGYGFPAPGLEASKELLGT